MSDLIMAIRKGVMVFPRDEYLRRLDAVKSELRNRDIETLVVFSQSNITYLTGYTALSAYVPQALIISLDSDEPTFMLRRMDAGAAIHQSFIQREKIIGYPENLVGSREVDGYDAIIEELFQTGRVKKSIGLELVRLSSASERKFLTKLSATTVVDCSDLVNWIRLVKSDLEITLMREAAAISDAAILRAYEVIRPGVREADVAAEVAATLARGANGKPGTNLQPMFLCSSPRTGTSHIPWSEDVLRPGSQVNLEVGGVRHGYVSALMRTYSIGQPSDRLKQMNEAEIEAMGAALEVARPGNTCGDIAEAVTKTLAKYGLSKESRCGYPIGIDWMEPTASLKLGDSTILQPNMTFHLMLGNWVDEEFGYALSETFRVTDSAPEVLTQTPRQLFII
ncbi:M24 family metallopeptidase [Pseudomonas fluorescens]|nr:Xaa-Pro peptidase family protein [Pseudomonas fluorescens]